MADLTGQRLGQYLILERISRGASSTVYKAYQEKLERYVAVKVLSPHFIDEEGFLDRFKQEARAVAQLDHPNILPVYDFDQAGDVMYIVMKYVDTGTLKDLMGAPLDLRVTLEIFTQIGLALGYAHRQGVIHRDVKPGNILLGAGNWALLTDFGLAKIRAGGRKLTKSGIGMGTPDYMAPEQAQGLPVDGRADLYSLGCMLYEMLTGKVPFEADSGMAVVVKHITESPRPPRELNPNLSLAVEQVLLKSIEKDPNKRYQSAESIVTDLTRAIGRVDQVFPPSKPTRPAAPARSRTAGPASPTGITRVLPTPTRLAGSRAALASGARRAGRWLRQAVVRASSQAQHGYERMSGTIAARYDLRRARLPTTTKRQKLKVPPLTPAQEFIDSVRERLTGRRVAVVGAMALLLVLVLVAVSNPGSSDARAQATPTSLAGVAPSLEATGAPEPTPPPAAQTAPPSTREPGPEPTALPKPPTGMLAVSGGTFRMGATSGSYDADETPPHRVTLSPFYIDAAEVTVAEFAQFAAGSGYVTDAEKKGDATTWRAQDAPDRRTFPVNRVSWNDATAFCRYYGKRLPTEAEWEFAGKGDSQSIYSWGNVFSAQRVNTSERGVGQPIAVAQLANASPFGAYDMIGNVWEWVADWYGGDYYAVSAETNPIGPASGLERVIRGGSFKSEGDRATTTIRRKASQDGWSDDIGFRCADDIP